MPRPRISVVIPVYQVEGYLSLCLDSLLAQTETDFELLAVDDGSTDGGATVLDGYAARDARVKVIRQPNRGVSAARNNALRVAQGEMIAFCDPDDRMEPVMLQTLLQRLAGEHCDAVFCGFFEERPDRVLLHSPAVRGAVTPEAALRWSMKRDGYFTSIWNKAFRRDALADENGRLPMFDESLNVGEDELWLVNALQRCGRVYLDPQPLYHWLWRPQSAIHEARLTERRLTGIAARQRAIEVIARDFPACLALAQASLYDGSFYLLPLAYGQKENAFYTRIRQAIRPYRRVFLASGDIAPLRKCKVETLNFLMTCRFPGKLVRWIASLTRTGIE